jgi:hypothetical protein
MGVRVGAMNGRSRSGPAGVTSVPQAEEIAWVVLRAANRKQARGSTARLVAPSVLEVAQEIVAKLGYDRLLAAEDYLLERGYIVRSDISLSRGAYTITPAGFRWLERMPGTP